MSRRDTAAELGWLLDVANAADVEHPAPERWVSTVLARLNQGGPEVRPAPLHRLLREIDEELADVPAWSLIALQAHPRARIIRPALAEVSGLVYAAHAILVELEVEGR